MDSFLLKSNRLCAEVFVPGKVYTGSRYDWSGMIPQVTLDGKHTFFPEGEAEPMGGRGLSGIIEFKNPAACCDETDIADRFPLMGVGLLKKPDTSPFCFFKPYDVLPFPREYSASESGAVFTTYPILCRGVAMRQTKTISVAENSLTIESRMENVGEKPLSLREFNHNFFCFDGRPVDDSYVLTLPYQPVVTVRRGLVTSGYNTVSIHALDRETASSAFLINGYEGLSFHFMKLENPLSGTGVSVEEDFSAVRFYNYCNKWAFCPETFCQIELEPGQSFTFSRKYTFYTL